MSPRLKKWGDTSPLTPPNCAHGGNSEEVAIPTILKVAVSFATPGRTNLHYMLSPGVYKKSKTPYALIVNHI